MIKRLLFLLALILGGWADRNSDCTQTKDLDLTIRACTDIIDRGKRESLRSRARAYTHRGIAYDLKGDPDRAIADYDKALAPENAKTYTNRGNAYAEKGEFDRAISDLDKAIMLDPSFAPAYNNRGVAYKARGGNSTGQ